MAALMLANGGGHEGMNMDMPMEMSSEPISNTVEFPYGFPSAGGYRILCADEARDDN